MKFFQIPYNWFKYLILPLWAKQLIQELNDILIALFKEVSKEYIKYLETKIIEASQMNATNKDKLDYVYKEGVKGFKQYGVYLKDSSINALIEFLYSKLKTKGII